MGQIFEIFEVPVPHDNKTGDAEFMKNYIFKNNFWKQVNLNSHNGLIYLNSGPNGLRLGPERSRLKICLFIQLLDSHTVSTKIVILRPSNHL